MRVLITGMGGQLGTLVAQRLEAYDAVETIAGYDLDPPRRRIRRASFQRISPRDANAVADFVRQVDPNVVVHLGIYEPHARLSPKGAIAATDSGTVALARALTELDTLQSIVVRSGIEVYGRRRGGPIMPDEQSPTDPTSAFGQAQLRTEEALAQVGAAQNIPVTILRFAPIAGSHTPSPLARLLRLEIVPVPALAEPTFSMVHADDAIDAIVAATQRAPGGPINVVSPGAVSALQAVRMGGHIPLPLIGPGWSSAGWLAEMAGAPLPDHVRELLVRGRCAQGQKCLDLLGVTPKVPVAQIVSEIHAFTSVEFVQQAGSAAA